MNPVQSLKNFFLSILEVGFIVGEVMVETA